MLIRLLLFGGLHASAVCQDQFVTIQFPSNAPDMLMTYSVYYLNAWNKERNCERVADTNRIYCPDLEASTTMTFAQLRDRYQREWNATRYLRGHAEWFPNDLSDFQKKVPYLTWAKEIIPMSAIKQSRRTIYRSPEDFPETISVAIADISPEIEIAIKAPSGHYEFYVYGADGKLTDHSRFPAGERPAPTVCAACHGDSATSSITRFIKARQ